MLYFLYNVLAHFLFLDLRDVEMCILCVPLRFLGSNALIGKMRPQAWTAWKRTKCWMTKRRTCDRKPPFCLLRHENSWSTDEAQMKHRWSTDEAHGRQKADHCMAIRADFEEQTSNHRRISFAKTTLFKQLLVLQETMLAPSKFCMPGWDWKGFFCVCLERAPKQKLFYTFLASYMGLPRISRCQGDFRHISRRWMASFDGIWAAVEMNSWRSILTVMVKEYDLIETYMFVTLKHFQKKHLVQWWFNDGSMKSSYRKWLKMSAWPSLHRATPWLHGARWLHGFCHGACVVDGRSPARCGGARRPCKAKVFFVERVWHIIDTFKII